MKVLYVDSCSDIGGGQRRFVTHLTGLRRAGVGVAACLLSENVELATELRARHIHVYLPEPPRGRGVGSPAFSQMRTLRMVLPSVRPNVVVGYSLRSILLILLVRIGLSFQFRCVFANLSGPRRGKRAVLEASAIAASDLTYVNSRYMQQAYAERWYYRNARFPYVYSAVEKCVGAAVSERRALRCRLSGRDPDYVLGCVGRVNPRKRVGDAISAVKLLREDYGLDAVLWVIGGSSEHISSVYGRDVRTLAEQALGAHCVFTGHVEDPYEYMSCLDLLVLASENEPYGRVLVESIMLGVPFVASVPGGAEEISEQAPGAGGLYPVGDVDRLAAEASEWLICAGTRNPGLPAALYPETIVDKEADLYRELVG